MKRTALATARAHLRQALRLLSDACELAHPQQRRALKRELRPLWGVDKRLTKQLNTTPETR